MIKITKKEVEVIKKIEIVVEPNPTALYIARGNYSKVETIKNAFFKEAINETYGTYLKFAEGYDDYYINIDIDTLQEKEDSEIFFNYDKAVEVHRKRREQYLKYAIASAKNEKAEAEEELERCEKLLKEFEKEKENENSLWVY